MSELLGQQDSATTEVGKLVTEVEAAEMRVAELQQKIQLALNNLSQQYRKLQSRRQQVESDLAALSKEVAALKKEKALLSQSGSHPAANLPGIEVMVALEAEEPGHERKPKKAASRQFITRTRTAVQTVLADEGYRPVDGPPAPGSEFRHAHLHRIDTAGAELCVDIWWMDNDQIAFF